MQFFDSLQQLGYSAINIALVFLVIMIVVYRSFNGFFSRQIPRAIFVAVFAAAFVFAINYFSEFNKVMMEAVKEKRATEQSEQKKDN